MSIWYPCWLLTNCCWSLRMVWIFEMSSKKSDIRYQNWTENPLEIEWQKITDNKVTGKISEARIRSDISNWSLTNAAYWYFAVLQQSSVLHYALCTIHSTFRYLYTTLPMYKTLYIFICRLVLTDSYFPVHVVDKSLRYSFPYRRRIVGRIFLEGAVRSGRVFRSLTNWYEQQ